MLSEGTPESSMDFHVSCQSLLVGGTYNLTRQKKQEKEKILGLSEKMTS
jgi:hypothetical protein